MHISTPREDHIESFDVELHQRSSESLDDEPYEGESRWGSDPFDIIAQLEDELGCSVHSS